jgi:hypothetical protein
MVPPEAIVADGGESETEIGEQLDELVVTDALLLKLELAAEVAVTVAVWDVFVQRAGAVYRPAEVKVPGPFRLQIIPWLPLPVTLALNCCVPAREREADAGVMVTLNGDTVSVVVAESELDPHSALTVADPAPRPVACPGELMAATAGLDEFQDAEFVTSADAPLL